MSDESCKTCAHNGNQHLYPSGCTGCGADEEMLNFIHVSHALSAFEQVALQKKVEELGVGNEALHEKLAAVEERLNDKSATVVGLRNEGIMQHAEIEALQLRVARLVDALSDIGRGQLQGPTNFADYAIMVAKRALSTTPQDDQAWLGEQKSQVFTLTEAAIDAPRGFLLGLELGIKNLEAMRAHLDRLGDDYSCWPDWAKKETGHITKAGKAILIFTMVTAELRSQSKGE